MRIVQLLATMAFGDAVSNDAAAIRKILEETGRETAIYASHVDPRLPKGYAQKWNLLGTLYDDDVLIYHGSTGDPLNLRITSFGGRKILRYHNITPSGFFRGYSRKVERQTRIGRLEIRNLNGLFEHCIADSDFNRQDLKQMGFECPIDVCPILIPFEDYQREPDKAVIERYSGDGWTNLLFVGRIAPNKKQEDIVRAFWDYRRNYNPKSRLFLVGNDAEMELYRNRLDNYIEALGLTDAVIFPGHISFAEILAYYRIADAFVCMSEHEGFCVPLVEAMLFHVPIVAYAAAAVPETMGKGGLLLDSKDPLTAAAAIDRVVRDQALREAIDKEQQKKLREYDKEQVKERFLEIIGGFPTASRAPRE